MQFVCFHKFQQQNQIKSNQKRIQCIFSSFFFFSLIKHSHNEVKRNHKINILIFIHQIPHHQAKMFTLTLQKYPIRKIKSVRMK